MADDRGADRSSIEVKTLVRKLHPQRGNHNDRIRQLNKFRNYVIADRRGPAEFYDDDLPILWLGASAPAMYLEEVNDDLLAMGMYGLLQACGTPSEKGGAGQLKRSARHAMSLLKWLVMDWKEPGQKKDELNLFAKSFLSLHIKHYHHMHLDLHCRGDDRGGMKEDACQIIVQILTKHMSEDGETMEPVMMEELLSSPQAQQEFELWSARHCSASVQDAIKKNAVARQAQLAMQQRQDALANKARGAAATDDVYLDENEEDDSENQEAEASEESETFDDGDDVVAAMRKLKKSLRKELKEAEGRGEITAAMGVATRWEDSQLAREQRARAASAARAGEHETVRDSQKAAQEAMEREEEKAKVLGKDPLGIIKEKDFDLSSVDKHQAEALEKALQELVEDLNKAEATVNEKNVKKMAGKKESLEAFLDKLGGLEALENSSGLQHSILLTHPKFNPLLFLTLVHRRTTFDTLNGSMERLSTKTENQVEQLQNLVRDNFPLFVRCAEGFEAFKQSSDQEVGLGLKERIDKLEGIAESCAFQAKKSFKPLLDNTSEVRKVQSAMAVLQRVAPILQVPALMRQHIENRRYSEALKTYRRVLVVDKGVKIELLKHVRQQAEELVLETRRALELRLANDKVSVEELLEGIRDADELLQVTESSTSKKKDTESKLSKEEQGIFSIGTIVINIRDHPPSLGCLLLQSAHFAIGVQAIIDSTEVACQRVFAGESLSKVQNDTSDASSDGMSDDAKPSRTSGNQWKYDILDSRVFSTVKSVDFLRSWLPRLLRIGRAAKEDEKRRAARIGVRRALGNISLADEENQLTAFEVFISNITPSVNRIVEHASFCALGSSSRSSGKELVMTFGKDAPEKLRALLRSPLPPSQSSKVAKELAELVDILSESSGEATALRPERDSSLYQLSPLDECKTLGDVAVVTIEKRRCIYAFDVCSRACANRASGSGKFDFDSLMNALQNLKEQLTRPEECSNEVEKGCELVIRRCCEGLASYVRDRGDEARLSAVAECADVLSDRIDDFVDATAALTPKGDDVKEVIVEDILGLESAMFDEYLENIRHEVTGSVNLSWLDTDAEAFSADGIASVAPSFPAYLSAALLAIVRCRAQVESALGDKVRSADELTYQHLAMATVAEGVVDGICNEIMQRKQQLKVRQADRLANELEFLKNTLKKFLNEEAISLLDSTLHYVASKAGRGRDYQGDGPDGLAALEELERLARVYVLCLNE